MTQASDDIVIYPSRRNAAVLGALCLALCAWTVLFHLGAVSFIPAVIYFGFPVYALGGLALLCTGVLARNPMVVVDGRGVRVFHFFLFRTTKRSDFLAWSDIDSFVIVEIARKTRVLAVRPTNDFVLRADPVMRRKIERNRSAFGVPFYFQLMELLLPGTVAQMKAILELKRRMHITADGEPPESTATA